jgi:hypothetical protein
LIPELIKKWQLGSKVVFLKRKSSKENLMIKTIKKIFYRFINMICEVDLIEKNTGSGIFDKSIIDQLKRIEDPDPYFRGMISEIEANIDTIEFDQPIRIFRFDL